MTITELQAFIDTKPDMRQIINEIADYLEANPPGGGNTIYTGNGSLAGDRTIDLNGHGLLFEDSQAQGGENYFLALNDPTYQIFIGYYNQNLLAAFDPGTQASILQANNVVVRCDGANNKIDLNATGGFSNDGVNYWTLGEGIGGAPTPDSTIRVRINGNDYLIAAEAD